MPFPGGARTIVRINYLIFCDFCVIFFCMINVIYCVPWIRNFEYCLILINLFYVLQKPGFKYANKQPVIKKDTATTSVLNGVEKQSQQQQQQPVISDTSDPKRIKLEKKKLPIVPPLVAPIIFSATVPPPVGVGAGAGAVGLVGSSSLAVLIPVVGLVPSSGGISDTGTVHY